MKKQLWHFIDVNRLVAIATFLSLVSGWIILPYKQDQLRDDVLKMAEQQKVLTERMAADHDTLVRLTAIIRDTK